MRIFLDTCALLKLYHDEADTASIEKIFIENSVSDVFLSDLTKMEFASALWKKTRTKELSTLSAAAVYQLFKGDFNKFIFIPVDQIIINDVIILIQRYGKLGLRTLDGIQLSTATYLRNRADLFITTDKLLNTFFYEENLATSI